MTIKQLNNESRIAVYLRKSREDEDSENGDTLRNHRDRLGVFIEENGFESVEWFEEVASGGSIDKRPVFSNLLDRVRHLHFDGVLVVAQDRLSRGDTYEQGIIERAFKESGTIVLMPTGESINYNDKNQGFVAGIKASFANYELEVIKERMTEGKKKRVLDGYTHNGVAPYGYEWNRNTKTMEVHPENGKTYRLMVNMFLKEDLSASEIARRFTDSRIPTPRGKVMWYAETVTRLLKNDFHKGTVIYGRFSRSVDGRIRQSQNETKMISNHGVHQTLKTEFEHIAIMNRNETLSTSKNRAFRSRSNSHKLSGLIYCKHCGKCRVVEFTTAKTPKSYIKKCLKKSATRTEECSSMTHGINEYIVYESIIESLKEYRNKLFSPSDNHKNEHRDSILELITYQEQSIEKSRNRIEKAKYMFMDGIIERDELKGIVEKEESNVLSGESKVSEMKASHGLINEEEKKIRKERWNSDDVVQLVKGGGILPTNEINEILRLLIDKIFITRDGNDLTIELKYK